MGGLGKIMGPFATHFGRFFPTLLSPPLAGGRCCRQAPKGAAAEVGKAIMSHLSMYHSADSATCGGHPLSGCAGLSQREACHLVLRSLPLPYSTAITDSLDSQVTHVPLRIQFTGVTQVPLPPLFRGQNRASLRLPAETYSGPLSFHAKTPLKNGLHFSGVFF